MSFQIADPSRVCILSGRFPPTEFRSTWNHRAYANAHGYTYVHCNWPTRAPNRYMVKFHFVREYLAHFDYIFWIDDDAFFIDLDQSLDRLVPEPNEIASFCKSPTNKEISTYLSSGQFMLRGGDIGLNFVNAVLQVDLEDVRAWWREDLGMFTNGDQDAIVYLAHESPPVKAGLRLFDYTVFNSRLKDLETDPKSVFVLHFTGPVKKKRQDYKAAAALLNTGPSLLQREAEEQFYGLESAVPRSWLRRGVGRLGRWVRQSLD